MVSIASFWEIAIKVSIGKLILSHTLEEIIKKLKDNKINILQIEASAILHLLNMPFHHKDPFDRLLIAQATVEGITLLTNDATVAKYQNQVRLV